MFKKYTILVLLSLTLSSKTFALHCSTPVTVSDLLSVPRFGSSHVALNEKGDAFVTWVGYKEGNGDVLLVAVKSAKAPWSIPQRIPSQQYSTTFLRSDIDAAGKMSVYWSEDSTDILRVKYAQKRNEETWSEPIDLKNVNYSELQDETKLGYLESILIKGYCEYARNDDTILAVNQNYIDSERYLQCFWFKNESWSQPQTLSTIPWYTSVNVALNRSNDAVVVFSCYKNKDVQPKFKRKIQAMVCTDETWSSPVDISILSDNAYSPKVAIDEEGNCLAVWEIKHNKKYGISTAFKPAGEEWQSQVDFFPEDGRNSYLNPRVVWDNRKNFVITWERRKSNKTEYWPPSVKWNSPAIPVIKWNYKRTVKGSIFGCVFSIKTKRMSEPALLSNCIPDADEHFVAFDKNGKGMIIWVASNNLDDQFIQVADLIVDEANKE
jgi:hypothetical protein